MEQNSTTLYVRERELEIRKLFTGADKPNSLHPLLVKWQLSLDVIADLFNVSIAFILQLQKDNLEILVASKNSPPRFRSGSIIPLRAGGSYYETTIATGEPLYVYNTTIEEDDSVKSYLGHPIRWPDGESFGALCVLDIQPIAANDSVLHILRDYQRLFEQDLRSLLRIRMITTVDEAQESRRREVSHRVKNHFAIISNLLQISAAKPQIGPCKQILADTDAKIRAMALLHELLYSSDSMDLPVSEYLTNVIEATLQMAPVETEAISNIETLPIIDSRNIFDLGLLISELTTNSIKNFAKHADTLIITLTCELMNDTTSRIIFRDNGPGFSAEFLDNPDRNGSIGYNMLRSFTHLMNGEFRQFNEDGAVIECTLRM